MSLNYTEAYGHAGSFFTCVLEPGELPCQSAQLAATLVAGTPACNSTTAIEHCLTHSVIVPRIVRRHVDMVVEPEGSSNDFLRSGIFMFRRKAELKNLAA
jgi:hypothetical protein